MVTHAEQPKKRSPQRQRADIWATRLALAARYRQAARRHTQKATEYFVLADVIEAEAKQLRDCS